MIEFWYSSNIEIAWSGAADGTPSGYVVAEVQTGTCAPVDPETGMSANLTEVQQLHLRLVRQFEGQGFSCLKTFADQVFDFSTKHNLSIKNICVLADHRGVFRAEGKTIYSSKAKMNISDLRPHVRTLYLESDLDFPVQITQASPWTQAMLKEFLVDKKPLRALLIDSHGDQLRLV